MKDKKNLKTGVYITVGIRPEQREALKQEARELDITIAKLVRRKLYGKKQTKGVKNTKDKNKTG